MAQQVGYFEDFASPRRRHEAYSEGPFVIVNPLGNGWRIECEVKDGKCPVLPDLSIYHLRDHAGFPEGKFDLQEDAERLCDFLNQQVREGNIVRDPIYPDMWAARRSATGCGPDCLFCVP